MSKKPPIGGNPTMTVELTGDRITVIGVFRKGRIDRGGSVGRVYDRNGEPVAWRGQTARRSDLGLDPVYQGPHEADGLLATLRELDGELRGGWTGRIAATRTAARPAGTGPAADEGPTEAHRAALLAGNDGTRWPDAFEKKLQTAATVRWPAGTRTPSPCRHEWPDGSTADNGWGLGVHRDRLEDAARRYKPSSNSRTGAESGAGAATEARFAWVDTARGLTLTDALPADDR